MQNAQLLSEHNAYEPAMQVAYASRVPKKKYEGPRLRRRQHWLKVLVDESGGPGRVGLEIDTPASHISAMTSGSRGVGDDLADRIEAAYRKPNGWLDRPLDAGYVAAPTPTPDLRTSIETLGAAIASASDTSSRDAACEMLVSYIKNPEANADMVPLILKRLLGGAPSSAINHEPPRKQA